MNELPVCSIGDTQRCGELMERHGVVVFRNVLSSEEIKTSEQKFWDWAERASPGLQRNEPKTHAELGKMGWGDTGIVVKCSVGIKFQPAHAIDATSFPRLRLLDGVKVDEGLSPRRRNRASPSRNSCGASV